MKLKKCKSCGVYTLDKECSKCGQKTSEPRPGPFSPQDKYGKHRRKEKLKKEG
ncbi:MAG: RNA-protein complex protein Nop10 [Candidatus Aenigmatarchaeota archaeon]